MSYARDNFNLQDIITTNVINMTRMGSLVLNVLNFKLPYIYGIVLNRCVQITNVCRRIHMTSWNIKARTKFDRSQTVYLYRIFRPYKYLKKKNKWIRWCRVYPFRVNHWLPCRIKIIQIKCVLYIRLCIYVFRCSFITLMSAPFRACFVMFDI